MNFENSKYPNLLQYSKVEFSFGTYFFFDNFVISELNEGIHFDWLKIQEVISAISEYYDDNFKIGYISNRINSYSLVPQLWIDFYKEYNFIVAGAIVAYNDFNYMNATLEKHFSKNSIKRCNSLEEAIEWMSKLKEFN
ncbi:hypothetical protein [Xanthomarina spongicola]|uniref:SpoIIAA-like protein n=1 Tax=Xanthomarina spongicola TaxID=570520 RepID=A0A316DKW9_9FLAO|nr:hypothetical protein [Xanthomarina spongicola]PWK17363.1 hypothetical protein LX78_02695 [Xanthomarina spongicola]